jgi:hypothetical protein
MAVSLVKRFGGKYDSRHCCCTIVRRSVLYHFAVNLESSPLFRFDHRQLESVFTVKDRVRLVLIESDMPTANDI